MVWRRTLTRFGSALRPSATRRSLWYGLTGGLIANLLTVPWFLLALRVPLSELDSRLPAVYVWAMNVYPLLLVAATGAHVARPTRLLRDGAIGGSIAGALFMLGECLIAEIIVVRTVVISSVYLDRLVLALLVLNLVSALVGAIVGAGLGALGAFADRKLRRRKQTVWPQSVGITVSEVGTRVPVHAPGPRAV